MQYILEFVLCLAVIAFTVGVFAVAGVAGAGNAVLCILLVIAIGMEWK